MRRAAYALGLAVLVLAGACLPDDESVERGAAYIHITAPDPKLRKPQTLRVVIDRLVVLAGAALPDCHSTYYVDRPSPPVAVFALAPTYTFEHRSLRESLCSINTGFINIESRPVHGAGVTQAEFDAVYTEGVTRVGSVLLRGYVDNASKFDVGYGKRFELVLTELRGGAVGGTDVPRGGHRDVDFRFETAELADGLLQVRNRDINGDGVITTNELTEAMLTTLRPKAGNAWRRP